MATGQGMNSEISRKLVILRFLLVQFAMRAHVQFPVDYRLPYHENHEQHDGLSESDDGESAEDNRHVQGDHARVGSHHLLPQGSFQVFLLAEKIEDKGNCVASDQSQRRPLQFHKEVESVDSLPRLAKRVTKQSKHKDSVNDREDPKMDEEKPGLKDSPDDFDCSAFLAPDQEHANGIDEPDDDVFEPVEHNDIKNPPAPEYCAEQGDRVGCDEKNHRKIEGS